MGILRQIWLELVSAVEPLWMKVRSRFTTSKNALPEPQEAEVLADNVISLEAYRKRHLRPMARRRG